MPEEQNQKEQGMEQKSASAKAMTDKAENFGKNIDKKIKKLPKPISALGDGVCITVVLFIIYWLLQRFNIISGSLSSIQAWVTIFIGVAVISLIVRYIKK